MAKRFTIPFVSLKGTNCRIDIYDSTYTGDAITISPENSSTPGYADATPITIEEENDENLLNVLRPKTGYINLIEKTYGSLQSLYPKTNTQDQVYVYYDNTLVFFGYIQAQSFENEWASGPRTLNLPIFSPLAIMDGQTFTENALLSDVTIGECLYECLDVYDDVILPRDLVLNAESGVNTPLQLKVNSRIVCPFNSDYNYGIPLYNVTPSPYTPINCQQFLVAFCNLYGLIAHEFGKTIIFSKFEYTDQYVRMQASELEEDTMDTTGMATGATQLALETYFSVASDNSSESGVFPVNKITYEYGEYTDSVAMNLSRSVYRSRVYLSLYDVGTLAILEPQTQEFSSSLFTINGGDLSTQNHVRVLGDGSKEMVEIYYNGADASTAIFSYTFCNVPNNISGATIKSTFTHEEGQADKVLRMTVMSEGKYYDINHDWVTTPQYLTLTFDSQGECKTYDVSTIGKYVTITIYPDTTDPTIRGMIEGFTIETYADPLKRYEILVDDKKVVKNSTPGQEDVSVEMLIHSAIGNAHCVTGGDVPLNRYSYMFQSQLRHIREVNPITATDMAQIYLKKISTTYYDGYFRVIAVSFDPVNDLYTLTMHNSETLN